MKEAKLQSTCLALALLLAPVAGEAQQSSALRAAAAAVIPAVTELRGEHLTPDSTIGDILAHPAFAGYGRQILPWDNRAYDGDLPITNIGSLLPYHSHVDPDVVVAGLNRMIEAVGAGSTIFYDIYSAAERRAMPDKQATGLFFFRGRPGAPFAVIAPGGGFSYVGSVHEGFPYALDISDQGYNAFVVKYRIGQGGRVATEDMAAAISFIFANAEALDVGTEDYSAWGSSAGARMAAFVGSHGTPAFGGDNLARPSTVVMAYTGHTDTGSDEPPTFVVVGANDSIAPPGRMKLRVEALRAGATEVEFNVYPDVGHGFGVGSGTSAEGWIADGVRFWERQMNRHP